MLYPLHHPPATGSIYIMLRGIKTVLNTPFLLPTSAQELEWKWSYKFVYNSCLNEKQIHTHKNTNVYTMSPIDLTRIDSGNSLSFHILHTTDVTGDAFTGDGWTALIREKIRLRDQLFSIWTFTKLISILEVNEW